MFNLTSFQNKDGIVEVKTLDSFYSSSTTIWDITEFIDTISKNLVQKQITENSNISVKAI